MTSPSRKICYLSGTRADFGLMQSTLAAIAAHPALSLNIVVTGMHLSDRYGMTVREIESAGFDIAARIPIDTDSSSGAAMARNLATTLNGCVDVFEKIAPDVVLLLGDRGEMLAAALAAIHLNIPIAHIHGGERSGTIDEPVRHALSKLAHWHFVATTQSRERLIRMGEHPEHVFVSGAPGLDALTEFSRSDRQTLCNSQHLAPDRPIALMIFHPVLQECEQAREQTIAILDALQEHCVQTVCLMPNSDAGNIHIRETLQQYSNHPDIRVLTHLPRQEFVSLMAICDLMIGNSSSGIIEAASFGTPVINVGIRQNMRERNLNTQDVSADKAALSSAIAQAMHHGRYPESNRYGTGHAAELICQLLSSLPITTELLQKTNAY